MKATTDDWGIVDWSTRAQGSQHSDDIGITVSALSSCLLELRAKVEALEAQAAQPAQAEQGRGAEPLWRRMYSAYLGVRIDANFDDINGQLDDWADVMNAVADWLQSGRGDSWAAQALRAEAQATREGRRG